MPRILFAAITAITLLAMLWKRDRLAAMADRLGPRLVVCALAADLLLVLLHLVSGGADFFYLNAERNLPTWFSTVQLFAVAMAVERRRRGSRHAGALDPVLWGSLALLFAYLALDESLMFHEAIGRDLSGRYFRDFLASYYERPVPTASAWPFFYLPFILGALVVLGVFRQRCLARSSPSGRRLFDAGVALFAAAILSEIAGMRLRTEAIYPAFIVAEEGCELLGATAFLGWAIGGERGGGG